MTSHHTPTPSDHPTLQDLFLAEGSRGRQVEFILVEEIGNRAWRVRSRWRGRDMPESTFSLTTATLDVMRQQVDAVADQCGLARFYIPSQPLPFHAPAVFLLTHAGAV